MRYIFVNCIAAGPVDWKKPLTAQGQPAIKECAMIGTDTEDESFRLEMTEPSGFNLNIYGELIASGAVVVGHSVDYHHGHLRATMIPMGLDPCDNRVKTVCTMMGLTGIAPKANGRRGWPTFSEACAWAGVERAAIERAEDNCRSLVQVFRAMERAGVVPEPKVWRERAEK